MALVKCKECGGDVSTTAKACPHCGAKPPKKTSFVTKFLAYLIFIPLVLGFVVVIVSPPDTQNINSHTNNQAKSNPSSLRIPSDTIANYTILEVGGNYPMKTITTKRVGSSGTSYSKRLYNCENNTVKYLGDGITIEKMNQSKPDTNMGPIVNQSIAYYIGLEACKT